MIWWQNRNFWLLDGLARSDRHVLRFSGGYKTVGENLRTAVHDSKCEDRRRNAETVATCGRSPSTSGWKWLTAHANIETQDEIELVSRPRRIFGRCLVTVNQTSSHPFFAATVNRVYVDELGIGHLSLNVTFWAVTGYGWRVMSITTMIEWVSKQVFILYSAVSL